MGLLSGAATVRRFRVVGDLPEGWRDVFRRQLERMAFQEPPSRMGKEEVEGWVRVQNLLDVDFDDFNQWLFQQFAVFALRVDKKVLPGKLLAAHVDKRCREWCTEHNVQRVPSSIRKDIKEKLEQEWLDRALPRVAVTELCWNVTEGWLILSGLSDSITDRVRKRFHRTFNLELQPWSPLDAVVDPVLREELAATVPVITGGDHERP